MATKYNFSTSIRKLNSRLARYRREIGIIYTLAIFAGLLQLCLPLGVQSIVSFVLAGSFSISIMVLIGLVLLGLFLSGMLQIRQKQILEKVKQKLYYQVSFEYSKHLPLINLEKADDHYLPELSNRYFDIVSFQKSLDKILIDIPAAIIQVGFGILLLSFYHPVFVGFGIVVIVLILVIFRLSSNVGFKTAMDASNYKYQMAAWLQEIARAIKTFKFARKNNFHLEKTNTLVDGYLKSRNNHFKVLLLQYWSMVGFKVLVVGAMLIMGSILLINNEINVGQFIAVEIVIISIIDSIEKLINNIEVIYDATVSVEKLDTVPSTETEHSGDLEFTPGYNGGMRIEFDKVSYGYFNTKKIINELSAKIPAGGMVQVKGPSGAGKTTLIRLLTGAYSDYTGNILIDDTPMANFSIGSIRSHTGILQGHQDVFEGTLLENLVMGNTSISLEEINKLAAVTGLDRFVRSNTHGYNTRIQPHGNKLPNAVSRTILLMRALLGSHSLLLLENPVAHLNEQDKVSVIKYLRQMPNVTSFIISNDDDFAPYCDKIINL